MGMQTSQYIQRIVSERTEEPLPEHLEEIDGLVLRKRVCHCLNQAIFKESIPKVKADKIKCFDGRLSYRKQQARLMNAVYDHFFS